MCQVKYDIILLDKNPQKKTYILKKKSISGDDGQSKEATSGTLMKESENVYALWCSGRVCVEGMLVELKLLKRQDLINVMANLFKPCADQIVSTYLFVCFTIYTCMVNVLKLQTLYLHTILT